MQVIMNLQLSTFRMAPDVFEYLKLFVYNAWECDIIFMLTGKPEYFIVPASLQGYLVGANLPCFNFTIPVSVFLYLCILFVQINCNFS